MALPLGNGVGPGASVGPLPPPQLLRTTAATAKSGVDNARGRVVTCSVHSECVRRFGLTRVRTVLGSLARGRSARLRCYPSPASRIFAAIAVRSPLSNTRRTRIRETRSLSRESNASRRSRSARSAVNVWNIDRASGARAGRSVSDARRSRRGARRSSARQKRHFERRERSLHVARREFF